MVKEYKRRKNGRKNLKQTDLIDNFGKFYNSREEVFDFLEIKLKCSWMLVINQNRMKQNRTEEDLKY